jgi:RES domain-containing protein
VITSQLVSPVELYRVNTPRYASTPLNGVGAAKAGGRFNRVGLEALYLSLDPTTAVAEFKQASAHLPPGTLCSYTATLPALVDLRQLGAGSWHPIWHDWNSDWRLIRADGRMDPPTWDMAGRLKPARMGRQVPAIAHVIVGHRYAAARVPAGHSGPVEAVFRSLPTAAPVLTGLVAAPVQYDNAHDHVKYAPAPNTLETAHARHRTCHDLDGSRREAGTGNARQA